MALISHTPRYKVVLLGDGGVGKSTWIKRLLPGSRNRGFDVRYVATLGVDVYPLEINTSYGLVIVDIWDTAGQEKFGGLRDGYYTHANGAIIMYDANSEITWKNTANWKRDFIRVNEHDNIVIACNKIGVGKKFGPNQETVMIDVKSGTNLIGPFLLLLRNMTGHNDLIINDY